MKKFFQEIKRRHVYKIATGYVVLSWVLIQVVQTLDEVYEFSAAITRGVATSLIIGFPVAVVVAWLYDITPGGIIRTRAARDSELEPMSRVDMLLGSVFIVLFFGFSYVAIRLLVISPDENTANSDSIPAVAEVARPPLNDKSIAILPLLNLSPDREDSYFAAGVHAELLNQMSKISELRVLSRSAVMRFQDSLLSPSEVARQLNVSNVVEGSVRFANDRVRVSIQLVQASDASQLWSETYERTLDDIFAIQTDIAVQVAEALQADLLPDERALVQLNSTDDSDVFSLFLEARYLQENREQLGAGETWLERALANMRRALEIDPQFPLGYAELGALTYQQWLLSSPAGQDNLLSQAELFANQALDIDPIVAQRYDLLPAISRAYEVLSLINFARRDWAAWEDYSRQLQAMSGGNSESESRFGFQLGLLGRYDEAYRQHQVASSQDASNPRILREGILTRLGNRNYNSALQELERFRLVGGDSALVAIYGLYAQSYLGQDSNNFELPEINTLETLFADTFQQPHIISYVYCGNSNPDEVLRLIDGLQSHYLMEHLRLGCHIGAGDQSAALDTLEKILELGLSVFPREELFDSLHSNPRWDDLARSPGFVQSL